LLIIVTIGIFTPTSTSAYLSILSQNDCFPV